MIIGIIIFSYWFVGFCYIQSFQKVGIPKEWIASIFIAVIWPYLMLVRFFAHVEFMAETKWDIASGQADKPEI